MGLNNLLSSFGEFIKGSRWRHHSKCKKVIKQLKARLVIQRKRRNSIIKQLREDISQLLQIGHHHLALARVEQLYRDECRLSAYNQLDNFCDCISMNLRDISTNSKLSDDVQEALSSMIFAASRCGELPELHSLRNLFKQHFGQAFDRLNVELLPGNMVNSETKQYLTHVTKLKEDVKLQIIDEIFSSFKSSSRTKDNNWVESLNCEIYTSKRTRRNKTVNNNNCNVISQVEFAGKNEEQLPRVQPQSPHVHPKLPDYDNLVVKFKDLKGENMYKTSTKYQSFSKLMRW
ncbi:uncharacterized protein LOC125807879 [Solanum verrucosum]|uniref:uncharacterized protein LOC125807879 n=1 Tax=Solanum verrucosum TaxID=315347 RepID=UPI0020D158C0|nr:uncharacterized protein LOC125807879 [Solanum verrucosum]